MAVLETTSYPQTYISTKNYSAGYRNERPGGNISFWNSYRNDEINGGYFTCLIRNGSVYDTGESLWLRGEQLESGGKDRSHQYFDKHWHFKAGLIKADFIRICSGEAMNYQRG